MVGLVSLVVVSKAIPPLPSLLCLEAGLYAKQVPVPRRQWYCTVDKSLFFQWIVFLLPSKQVHTVCCVCGNLRPTSKQEEKLSRQILVPTRYVCVEKP